MAEWLEVCALQEIEQEGVTRFDHAGKTFAVYRSVKDEVFATDGLCTHEAIHLSGGFVSDYTIECPKHNGRFDFRTGEAKGAPVCSRITTYPAKIEKGRVFIEVS